MLGFHRVEDHLNEVNIPSTILNQLRYFCLTGECINRGLDTIARWDDQDPFIPPYLHFLAIPNMPKQPSFKQGGTTVIKLLQRYEGLDPNLAVKTSL